MSRLILAVAGVTSISGMLLFDSTVKGSLLLILSSIAALLLRRDSAATRHLVWQVALVALLVVPLLSAVLPQWRVLPVWISSSEPAVASSDVPTFAGSERTQADLPTQGASTINDQSPTAIGDPLSFATKSATNRIVADEIERPTLSNCRWISMGIELLPSVWAFGVVVLISRLAVARWLLQISENVSTRVCERDASGELTFDRELPSGYRRLAILMDSLCTQLGTSRSITLLIHPAKTIPVVWGIMQCRLLLPAAALDWSEEQLKSVLLHELAHIKRRDTLVQLLSQIACAVHWLNPLVWLAAWRLGVERELACDDLVLASGVRPSEYAGHLLNVVTEHSSARWTQACGLAMARKSSLEDRLIAVLGKDRNRRDVSLAISALTLFIVIALATPIAMLRGADAPWRSPTGVHIGGSEFSTYCVSDGDEVAFVIAYFGDLDSETSNTSSKSKRTWTDSGKLTADRPGIVLSFHRESSAPGKLSLTTVPSKGRDLSKPPPPARDFGQREIDLKSGRVLVLTEAGTVRQFDIKSPIVRDPQAAAELAKLIAAFPPQEREKSSTKGETQGNVKGKLKQATIDRLQWGEPVNGLSMAVAWPPVIDDPLIQREPYFQLVVQNVSDKVIHFVADDQSGNPRKLLYREGESTIQAISDPKPSAADWKLQPDECGIVRLFTSEMPSDDGTTPSSAIEGDLSKTERFHAIVRMEIAQAPAGAWTGKLVSGPTRGSADIATGPKPKLKEARALYELWQRHTRRNGDIPGALVGDLAAAIKQFITYNPTWETVPKLNTILPRLDSTRDWTSADTIALLDNVTSIQNSPVVISAEKLAAKTIRNGTLLPNKYEKAVWGEVGPNGIRSAWILEPTGNEFRIGTALKGRLLLQNTGSVAVIVRVPTWQQGNVTAHISTGSEVEVVGIDWTTIPRLVTTRLAPNEIVEINTPGVGVGPRAGMLPWAGPRIGSNVLAKPGDEVALTHSPVVLDGNGVGRREDDPHIVGAGWWLAHIKRRLSRELPLPDNAEERRHLLDRAVRDLFGTPATADEIVAFTSDDSPSALDAVANHLANRKDLVEFSGLLSPAQITFRVLAADPAADKIPRVALGPGEYPVGPGTTLKIIGRPDNGRVVNDSKLIFEANEATGKLPPKSYPLEVPDGWGTWAIASIPQQGFFYVFHKGNARKVDFRNPLKVTETLVNDFPAEFRDEVLRQLDIAGVSLESQRVVFEKPAPPAATPATKVNNPK